MRIRFDDRATGARHRGAGVFRASRTALRHQTGSNVDPHRVDRSIAFSASGPPHSLPGAAHSGRISCSHEASSMTRDLDIVRARVYAVAPPSTPPYRWTGQDGYVRVTDNIVRLTALNGLEGVASNTSNVPQDETANTTGEEDRALADRLGSLARSVLGTNALVRESHSERCLAESDDPLRHGESLIDVALWDLVGKALGVPLWSLLGGARRVIPAYASTPVLEAVEDYEELLTGLYQQGFGAAKIHVWCEPERDLELIRYLAPRFEGRMRLMLDVEQRYNFDDAVIMGRELAHQGAIWFEAPLPDTDLEAYVELRRAVDIPIICAGNTINALGHLDAGLTMGAWSSLRTGPTHAGGISSARRAMALAEARGVNVELQSYGYEGRKLASLHLALGCGNCSFFEMPVPFEHYEYEMQCSPPRPDGEGLMHAPTGSGLGLEMDWQKIEADAFVCHDLSDETS